MLVRTKYISVLFELEGEKNGDKFPNAKDFPYCRRVRYLERVSQLPKLEEKISLETQALRIFERLSSAPGRIKTLFLKFL